MNELAASPDIYDYNHELYIHTETEWNFSWSETQIIFPQDFLFDFLNQNQNSNQHCKASTF